MVPPASTFRLPDGSIVSVIGSVPPPMLIVCAKPLSLRVGWWGVVASAWIFTSVAESGTVFGSQFPPVLKSVLVVPVQLVCACAADTAATLAAVAATNRHPNVCTGDRYLRE